MAKKITWQLKTYKLADLTDYFKNPRHITETEFKQLKKSLDTFGLIDKPIINADAANTIIGGHQRKHVLEANGETECECWVPDRELTEREVEELNIRLNKNTGSWDFDTLANEFELDDLLEWGFDKGELDLDLWAEDAPEDVEPQIDKAEELRVKWGVETGQLWQLGEHRLICGDCTDRAVVERVMGGEKADIVLTDPPYNVGFDYGETGTDDRSDVEYESFSRLWFEMAKGVSNVVLFTPGTGRGPGHPNLKMWFSIEWPYWIIAWVKKNALVHSSLGGFNNWEPVLLYGKPTKKIPQDIYDIPITVQKEVADEDGNKLHPVPKQVSFFEALLKDFTNSNQTVIDLFLGSGTTLIACERLGRKCRAVEISPAYVAVAIQRWVDVTGGEPVMLSN